MRNIDNQNAQNTRFCRGKSRFSALRLWQSMCGAILISGPDDAIERGHAQ
jgi:hypothetical protein